MEVQERAREALDSEMAALDERLATATAALEKQATRSTSLEGAWRALSDEAIKAEDKGKKLPPEKVEALRDADRRAMAAFGAHLSAAALVRELELERERLRDPRALVRREKEIEAREHKTQRLRNAPRGPRKPGVREAAAKVLLDEGRAMHYREITALAIERGLWEPRGKTPEASMNAALAVEAKKGERFVRVAPSVFDLKERAKQPEGNPTEGGAA